MDNVSVPLIDQKESGTISYLRDIEERILHVLSIYPKISPSMLQIGLGSNVPPKIWRPVLQQLMDKNLVVQETIVNMSPKGRSQTHIIIKQVQV